MSDNGGFQAGGATDQGDDGDARGGASKDRRGRRPHAGWRAALTEIDARIDAALSPADGPAAPLIVAPKNKLAETLGALGDPELEAAAAAFAAEIDFRGGVGESFILPGPNGAPRLAVMGGGDEPAARVGAAPMSLPNIQNGWRPVGEIDAPSAMIREWLLGAYQFERYKGAARTPAPLALAAADAERAEVAGAYFARDLVNTPAGDLGPDSLEEAARALAEAHGAQIEVIAGDALLDANFPMIHAVGRAAAQAPRLLDITWSGAGATDDSLKVALVGKGVCFDTGGLDIKPARAMRNMKKDMGGSAAALGAAMILMRRNAPLHLRVLIPAVENAVGPNSFRPGDVLDSRAGLTVEIEDTDAEGRLVLGDALTYAAEAKPAVIVDFATLTGAARVALGPELPPLYCADNAFAYELLAAGASCADPLWRMPLHQPYASELSSSVADLKSASTSGFAGSVTAALFLKRFVGDAPTWAHLDIFAWNPKTRPGRPEGGEAQGARAVAKALLKRCGVA